MVDHLFVLINQLYHSSIVNARHNGRRMSSVMAIVCFLSKIIPDYLKKIDQIPHEYILQMLSMFRFMPDLQHETCVDFDYLRRSIPNHYTTIALTALIGFVIHASSKVLFWQPEWLYSVPLVHFLAGASKPFQKFNFDPKKIEFGDKVLLFGRIKGQTSDAKHYRFVFCYFVFIVN